MSAPDNPRAFPSAAVDDAFGGMSLHDWFAGQALMNPALCDGQASQWELKHWFGERRTGIRRAEIVAKQAAIFADAMLAKRGDPQ